MPLFSALNEHHALSSLCDVAIRLTSCTRCAVIEVKSSIEVYLVAYTGLASILEVRGEIYQSLGKKKVFVEK